MNISVDGNYTEVPYKIYTGANSINLILGLPLNVYVLWLMVTGERGTMVSNFFALNLTISELLSYMAPLMFILNDNTNYSQLVKKRFYNTAIFFYGLILAGRPLFQCFICLERYIAVVHPITFLMYKPLRYKMGCGGVVWIMVLGCCFAYMSESYFKLKYFTLCLILVTCSVMLFCCLAVLRVLKRPKPEDVEADGGGTNNMRLRAFRIILAILVSMMVMYLPLTIFLIVCHLLDTMQFHLGNSICFSITTVTGFVQPILYLHRAGKIPCIKGV